MNKYLLAELSTSVLGIRPEAISNLRLLLEGTATNDDDIKQLSSIAGTTVITSPYEDITSIPSGSVAIIPIIGIMHKYGYKTFGGNYISGMDDVAEIIRRVDKTPNIAASILLFNTPGGFTQSLAQIEGALSSRKKPCSAVIDGQCCSCGIYVASFCDNIFATHPMCEVGSIGVYLSLMNNEKFFDSIGVKFIDVYPPESARKNLPYREAIKGNTVPLIEESLTPFALHFQNTIKNNRKGLKLSCDGILEGRVFYAKDAVQNGLVDAIKSIDEVTEMVLRDATDYNSIINLKF